MQQLNAAFRGVFKTTDVLSFPQVEFGDKNKTRNSKLETRNYILGDVVINIQMAALRAKLSGTDFYGEVYHLLIHGVLHLLGYNHEKSRYKAMTMMKKEKEILNAIKKMG
jgi:rRNA maturation RNase YbeY